MGRGLKEDMMIIFTILCANLLASLFLVVVVVDVVVIIISIFCFFVVDAGKLLKLFLSCPACQLALWHGMAWHGKAGAAAVINNYIIHSFNSAQFGRSRAYSISKSTQINIIIVACARLAISITSGLVQCSAVRCVFAFYYSPFKSRCLQPASQPAISLYIDTFGRFEAASQDTKGREGKGPQRQEEKKRQRIWYLLWFIYISSLCRRMRIFLLDFENKERKKRRDTILQLWASSFVVPFSSPNAATTVAALLYVQMDGKQCFISLRQKTTIMDRSDPSGRWWPMATSYSRPLASVIVGVTGAIFMMIIDVKKGS